MNRKQKFYLNTATGIIKQFVVVICGFILPRFLLLYFGSEVNGLVSSITHYLSFISFMDMGVGSVVRSNLYKPLADRDTDQTSKIMASAQKFFRRIAYIFLAYIVVLVIVLPRTIGSAFGFWFTASLIVIIAISTFAQYFFGITNEILLYADQRSYFPLSLHIGTVILNTVLAILLIKAGASIHIVKLVTASIYVLRPLGQSIYVKRNYEIDRNIKYDGEPIKQKWNGFSQHLAAVICENVDVVVLSLFSTLSNVSVYSVYYLVTNGVTQVVMTAATGVEALFGNMLAKKEDGILLKTFEAVEWVVHTGVTFIFCVAAITIVPFVSVYTKGINDANYIVPLFGILLIIAYASQCLRIPYFRIIKAAGHFKQTQNGAFISAALNILITIILVFKLGLVGVAIGTLVAMLYQTCYFVWYLKDNILRRKVWHFVKYIITDTLVFISAILLCRDVALKTISYWAWIIMAIKVSIITFAITIVINGLFYRDKLTTMFRLIKKRIK